MYNKSIETRWKVV